MTASRSKIPPRPSLDLPPDLYRALQGFIDALETDLAPGSLAAYRYDLTGYLGAAARQGVESPSRLTPAVARTHLEALSKAGRRPATVARCLASMRRFHQHLQHQGLCPGDATVALAAPPVKRRQPVPLTVAQADRLMAAAGGARPLELRDRAILELLYGAGLRVSELTALTPEDLLLHEGLLRVRGHGPRQRSLPLGLPAMKALRHYLQSGRPVLGRRGPAGALFLNAGGRPLTRMGVWKAVRAAARAAGLRCPVSPQSLRHTFAAHLLEGGLAPGDLQRLLGHADLATTMIYAGDCADDDRLAHMHRACHPRGGCGG